MSGDLVGATAFLDTLPPAVRTSSGIRKLDKRLTREARAADKLTRRTARDSPPVVEETDTEVSVTDAVLGDADTVPMEEESTDTPANDEGTGTDQLADTEVPPPATAEPPSPCDALRTAVRARACSAAIEHYPACPEGLGDADIAATILGCLLDTGDVATATTFEESLTQEIRGLARSESRTSVWPSSPRNRRSNERNWNAARRKRPRWLPSCPTPNRKRRLPR